MYQVPAAQDNNASPVIKNKIFINPNFQMAKTHINPLFVQCAARPAQIHMNPKFLTQQIATGLPIATVIPQAILPSRPSVYPGGVAAVHINPTRHKLVRTAVVSRSPTKRAVSKIPFEERPKIVAVPTNIAHRYKLDRRPKSAMPLQVSAPVKRIAAVANNNTNKQTVNERRLRLVNINGVQYKSTYNKLQRRDVKQTKLTSSGIRLSRASAATAMPDTKLVSMTQAIHRQGQRIDVGGLTFVLSRINNVWLRPSKQLTLAHLSNARQRSLQLLTRHLKKSNVPCTIFQRLGKCIAYERGKCNKVHDKKHVIICPKFLQGDCSNARCLLSHQVSLSKMPVCKFYLQGLCVRTDCPYLHKKLSGSAEICQDFLHGFCRLADQCNKRHEFVCSHVTKQGRCVSRKCYSFRQYNMALLRKQRQCKPNKAVVKAVPTATLLHSDEQPETNDTAANARYFSSATDDASMTAHKDEQASGSDDQSEPRMIKRRPKLGTLPAFIPIV